MTIAKRGVEREEFAEFSNGVIVACRHRHEGDAIVLTISPHRTARGTDIGEKTWKLLPEAAAGGWKIVVRAE